MKFGFAMLFFSLSLASFAQVKKTMIAKPLEATKAKFQCVFKPSKKSDLTSLKLTVDLVKASAFNVVDWSGNDESSKLSVLTFSRAQNDKDKTLLTKFQAYESSQGKFIGPNTLVIAGSNGDNTDQTLVIQYQPRAESKKELMENRAKGETDYRDINLTYIQSVHGSSHASTTTCTMEIY